MRLYAVLFPFVLLCGACSGATRLASMEGDGGPPPEPVPVTTTCPDGSVATPCAYYASENASAEFDPPPVPLDPMPQPSPMPERGPASLDERDAVPAGPGRVVASRVLTTSSAIAVANPPEKAVPCEAIRQRMATAAACREYARQRAALAKGIAAFQPPPVMIVGAPTRITLQLGAAGEATAVIESLGGDPAKARSFEVTIGDSVAAELSGPAEVFKIAPAGRVVKQMPDNSRQSWSWDVTPLAPGAYSLTLTVGVPAMGDAGAADFYLDSKDYPVKVRAKRPTPKGLIEAITEFLGSVKGMLVALAAVIAAASALWIGLRKFGKAPTAPPAPPA